MDATRSRSSFAADWLIAVALLIGTVIVAALVVSELRTTGRAIPSSGVLRLPAEGGDAVSNRGAGAAAAVPPEAVLVPTLTLGASEIKVGDRMADALSRLEAASKGLRLVGQAPERGPLGPREIVRYDLSGTGFILIFEAFERRGEMRVAAIYLI